LRIAVNTRFLLRDKLEGIGWFTFEVMQRLVNLRPDDEFVFIFDRPFDPQFLFEKNVEGLSLFPPARHPMLWYWWFEWSLPRILRKKKVDLLFSPDGFCSLNAKTPTIMVTHDIAHHHFPEQVPSFARWYYKYFIPRYLKKADHIITVSDFTKKDIEQAYAIPHEKMTVAHNGSRHIFRPLEDMDQVKTREKFADSCPYFFYFGAVHPRKNVHRLIAAFDRFKQNHQSKIKLLIGGRFAWQTGPVKTAYEKAVHKKDIQFLGYLSEKDLTALTASALALTYISNFEGFGLPILEAMHCEVPIITSNISSLPEVAGEAALYVNPDEITEIENALFNIWDQPLLRQELIEKGKIQRTQFYWDKTAAIINETIDRVLL
jgi:glycosyltransferase involved in cell wall biosynthesis